MRKMVFLGLAAVAAVVLLGIGTVWYAQQQAEARAEARMAAHTRALAADIDAAFARLEAALDTLAARFETIDDLKTAQELQLRRYRNADHLQSARALGTAGTVSSLKEVQRLEASGRLVRLRDNAYYTIQELDYSVPYVTPDAAALLDELGRRFHATLRAHGLPAYRFVISSVLRTAENQDALRQINPNATYGTSTHEFGTTVDIVYHTYAYQPEAADGLPPSPHPFLDERIERLRRRAYDALGMRYWQELQGMLGRTLIELQAAGAVRVTLEREQPVFHLTVAAPLAGQTNAP